MIASVSEFRTLIYTGGEPLVRPDIFELLRHSQKAGLANIIATNGTLINEEMAFKLKDHGVARRDSGGGKDALNDFPKSFDCIKVHLIIPAANRLFTP
jgi:sulfatase maturation enzyme AslB (radical SAM superfamily)